MKRSPWVLHFNSGACNGCDIEVIALLTPRYDIERFGIRLEPSPRHADVLLVTGCVTRQCAARLARIYEQMPDPKFVVAIGACACSGGVFAGNYNVLGGVDKVIPVNMYIPNCPPRPEAIIDGVAKLLGSIGENGRGSEGKVRGDGMMGNGAPGKIEEKGDPEDNGNDDGSAVKETGKEVARDGNS